MYSVGIYISLRYIRPYSEYKLLKSKIIIRTFMLEAIKNGQKQNYALSNKIV